MPHSFINIPLTFMRDFLLRFITHRIDYFFFKKSKTKNYSNEFIVTQFLNYTDDQDQRSKEKKFEDYLLYKIKHGSYEDIENEIKPRALKYCESNSLLMGMKVSTSFLSMYEGAYVSSKVE